MFFESDLNDFWSLFDVYVIDVTSNREEIIGIVFTPDTNMSVNFTI